MEVIYRVQHFFLFSYMPAELHTSFDSKTTEIQMDEEKKIIVKITEKKQIYNLVCKSQWNNFRNPPH